MKFADFRYSLVLGLSSVASSSIRKHLVSIFAHEDYCRIKQLGDELLQNWQV